MMARAKSTHARVLDVRIFKESFQRNELENPEERLRNSPGFLELANRLSLLW